MVDTVAILARWILSADVAFELKSLGFYNVGDWQFHTIKQADHVTGEVVEKLSGRNLSNGIKVRGRDGVIEWVECSLPRLLHGYNGRLITDPFQLEAAVQSLYEHLRAIASAEEEIREFIRVDLVLNLPCDPKRVVAAHRNSRHPWVRTSDVQYGDTGIRFPGKHRVVQMYWKQKERADKSGFNLPPLSHSIRVELQLKDKDAVRRVLTGKFRSLGEEREFQAMTEGDKEREREELAQRAVRRLDFFQCYRIFRSALCLFDGEPPTLPKEKCTLLGLIAECEAQGFRIKNSIGALEWYKLSGQKPETLRKAERAISLRKRELIDFCWSEILPPLRLPESVVDIYADGTAKLLRDLW